MGIFSSKKQTVLLSVDGMMCSHCAAKVEKGLKALKGVKDVKVDLAEKKVEAVVVDKAPSELVNAVNALGFSASIIEQ